MGESLLGLVFDVQKQGPAGVAPPAARTRGAMIAFAPRVLATVWPRVEADMRALLERHRLAQVRIERDEPPEQTPGGKTRPIIPFKPKGHKYECHCYSPLSRDRHGLRVLCGQD